MSFMANWKRVDIYLEYLMSHSTDRKMATISVLLDFLPYTFFFLQLIFAYMMRTLIVFDFHTCEYTFVRAIKTWLEPT